MDTSTWHVSRQPPRVIRHTINVISHHGNPVLCYLLIIISSWLPLTGSCPASCVCDVSKVTCMTLSGFPVDVPVNTTHLTITDSELGTLTRDEFIGLGLLEVLDLTDCGISEIHQETFSHLPLLHYLSLEANRIETLVGRTFTGLALNRLYLSNNTQLTHIDTDTFHNSTVNYLYIQHTSLSSVSLETVVKALGQHLRRLDVSHTTPSLELPDNLLQNSRIRELIFRYNGLRSVSFLSQVSLELLDVSGNAVADQLWPVVEQNSALIELILEDVNLTAVPPSLVSSSLIVLNLGRNRIGQFPGGYLQGLVNLRTLILTGNRLLELPLNLGKYLAKLTVLDVSHNQIDVINPAAISSLTLFVFDARGNRITSLSSSLVQTFNKAINLDLSDNPYHCNCNLAWLAQWIRDLPFNRRDVHFGSCVTPVESTGKLIRTMRSSEFICKSPIVLLVSTSPSRVGQNVQIHCKAKGDPAPVLHLYSNSTLLRISELAEDRLEQLVSIEYRVAEFSCADISNYTCLGTSVAGLDQESEQVGLELWAACHENYTSTSTSTTTTTTTPAPSTTTLPDDTTRRTNLTEPTLGVARSALSDVATVVIPVVVVLAVLIVVSMCVAMTVWYKRTRQRYNLTMAQARQTGSTESIPTFTYPNAGYDSGAPGDYVVTNNPIWPGNGHVLPTPGDITFRADDNNVRDNGASVVLEADTSRDSPVT